jgi:hypothetical protein
VVPGAAKRLKWGVAESQRDPVMNARLHDDLLVSAALCAELDGFEWPKGEARSFVIPPADPLARSGYGPVVEEEGGW